MHPETLGGRRRRFGIEMFPADTPPSLRFFEKDIVGNVIRLKFRLAPQ
jgi:hypothetical protein